MTSSNSVVGTARPVTPVGILAEKLARVIASLHGVDGVAPTTVNELREAYELASGLDPYLDVCTTAESPALRALAERTRTHDWVSAGGPLEQEMLSGHVEGQALAMLVRLTRARRVLDIGMFTGYSALAMAEALPEGGEVVACEIDAEVAAFAQECFAASDAGHRISVRVAPARRTLMHLAERGEPFDLVFLDADKPGYLDYLNAVLDAGLLAPHGVVCADNTLLQGLPYIPGPGTANGSAIAVFNAAVAADPRVEQVLLPLRDGLTLIRWADGARP